MKLNKKHIGKLFDVTGSDGSWAYQLIDIKGKEALFYSIGRDFWALENKHDDWRPFKPQMFRSAKDCWPLARRNKE